MPRTTSVRLSPDGRRERRAGCRPSGGSRSAKLVVTIAPSVPSAPSERSEPLHPRERVEVLDRRRVDAGDVRSLPSTSAVSERTCEAAVHARDGAELVAVGRPERQAVLAVDDEVGVDLLLDGAFGRARAGRRRAWRRRVTSVRPIISAAAVEAVRPGLRTALAPASSPATPPARAGRPGRRRGRAAGPGAGRASRCRRTARARRRRGARRRPASRARSEHAGNSAASEIPATPSPAFRACAAKREAGTSRPRGPPRSAARGSPAAPGRCWPPA